MTEVKFKVTEDRLADLPTGVWRQMKNDETAQCKYVAHFMVDEDGEYLDPADALAVVDDLPLRLLGEAFKALRDQTEEAAVPKT